MSDPIKPSRLLLRLEGAIATAATPLEADSKRLELAIYWARQGRLDEAKRGVEEVKGRYRDAPNVLVSSWVNLAHGIIEHCRSLDPKARDKVLRAHALSSAGALFTVRARSAAWLSHMDYLAANIDSMVAHALEALRLAEREDHSTRSRASLVLAQAYHLAGRLDLAAPWYHQARLHITAEGDDLTLSALMHNRAWLIAQELRIGGWLRSEVGEDRTYALVGAQSIASFDSAIGSNALITLIPILQAQIYSSLGQYELALSLYEKHLEESLEQGMGRLKSDLLADQAWCRVQLGQLESARRDALLAEESIDPEGYFDDRVMAHGRLAQVCAAMDDNAGALKHKSSASEMLVSHRHWQMKILASLEKWASQLLIVGILEVVPPTT